MQQRIGTLKMNLENDLSELATSTNYARIAVGGLKNAQVNEEMKEAAVIVRLHSDFMQLSCDRLITEVKKAIDLNTRIVISLYMPVEVREP